MDYGHFCSMGKIELPIYVEGKSMTHHQRGNLSVLFRYSLQAHILKVVQCGSSEYFLRYKGVHSLNSI